MKELSIEKELKLEKNLVWIFADRRSGTTWLGKELLSYGTKFMDEPLIGLHLGRYVTTKSGIKRTIINQGNRPDYFFSKKYEDVWQFFIRKLILNRVYSQFNDLSQKVIIKEPTGSISADIIAKCLPNSRIMVLIRDGRDVIDSKVDEVSKGGWELKLKKGAREELTAQKRISHIKKISKYWVGLMEILLETYHNHPKNLRHLLQYETLRENTAKELKKIYHFLDIDIDDKNLENIVNQYSFEKISVKQKGKGKFRRFASPGKWKENFSDEEKKLMNGIMGDMLVKLGYKI